MRCCRCSPPTRRAHCRSTGVDPTEPPFGSWSGGFWLPECAYRPGIEEQLAPAGVRAFCVDQTIGGDPLDQLEPVGRGGRRRRADRLEHDLAGLGRPRLPADPVYRDYHAHTVNGMRAWANGGRPTTAMAAAQRAPSTRATSSRDVARTRTSPRCASRPGSVCALDTELLGHWWYEGPQWLDAWIEEAERRARARDAAGGA